jgi:RHS repeat-associated protein
MKIAPSDMCNANRSYDKVGNVTQRQNNTLGLTENFYYDNVYRLDYSQLNGVTNLDLTCNNLGNITNRTDVASNAAAWTYHATKKHAVTQAGSASFAYTYDANGNAITRNGFAIGWNKSNYPTSIAGSGETASLYYDGNNQRWKQVYVKGATTETTIYVGGDLEKVTTGTTVDWRHYIKANNQTIAIYSRQSTGTNTFRYLLEDHQGSPAKITTGTGATYVSENFSAFGNRRNPATWSGAPTSTDLTNINAVSRQGYTGHDFLGSLGLNHMNGRVQDSITGRFISADPYITEPGNTQNYNRYSYVYNNPMSFVDPSGYESSCGPQIEDGCTIEAPLPSPSPGVVTETGTGENSGGNGGGDSDTQTPSRPKPPKPPPKKFDACKAANDTLKAMKSATSAAGTDALTMAGDVLSGTQQAALAAARSAPSQAFLDITSTANQRSLLPSAPTISSYGRYAGLAKGFGLAGVGLNMYQIGNGFAQSPTEGAYATSDALISAGLSAFGLPGVAASVAFNEAGGSKSLVAGANLAALGESYSNLSMMCAAGF